MSILISIKIHINNFQFSVYMNQTIFYKEDLLIKNNLKRPMVRSRLEKHVYSRRL